MMDPVLTPPDVSPHARSASLLSTFLRGRPRDHSQAHIPLSDTVPPTSPSLGSHRRRPAAVSSNSQNTSNNFSIQASLSNGVQSAITAGGLSQMLRRRRSVGTLASAPSPAASATNGPQPALVASISQSISSTRSPYRIRLVPHLDSRRSLRFEPISRDVKEGDPPLRIGRFTDRSGLGIAIANSLGSNKLAFKSKVVSRAHAEIWAEIGGKFWIKDTKSSSGTFLNHVRLSAANTESRPFEVKDGDILQLGVDYQGGTEDIYKCVKIKIEVGREWQTAPNAFNTNAIKQLRALSGASTSAPTRKISTKAAMADCCICLFAVAINQALFIAPCSHAFHYKCIRPLLDSNHPAFSCPLCRTFADLEEDVEVEIDPELDLVQEEDPKTVAGDEKLSGNSLALGGISGHGPANVATAAAIIKERREREVLEEAVAAGAETEVELDVIGSSRLTRVSGTRWQGRTPVMPGAMIVDLTEADDEDEHMVDMRSAESQSPSPVIGSSMVDGFARDQSLSPVPGYGGPSGSGAMEDGITSDSDGGSAEGDGLGEGPHFHGKRKR